MFEALKRIFSSSSGPPVIIEPVSFQDGLLLFKSEKPLKLTKSRVAAPSKKGFFEIEIEILSFEEKSGLYRGKLKDETFSLDAMQMERRKEFRLDVVVPVTSQDLPGKKAVTEDISLNGARVLLNGPLKTGDHVGLTFHFGDKTLPDQSLRCEVQWCVPTRKNKHHCGVRFFMIEKAQKDIIKRFAQNRMAIGG